MDLSAVPAPVLRFNSDYRALGGFADVGASRPGSQLSRMWVVLVDAPWGFGAFSNQHASIRRA
ncbi:hypothetical protein [Streptomyces carpinensis]|uniref:Uncharacterized protein n=1 Tax=Streptomyces carpinensis TaxID=66369 RepID=A0ABV1WHB7_9ACTN|nr:hypothetical protein [Streptomyces carpinensis]